MFSDPALMRMFYKSSSPLLRGGLQQDVLDEVIKLNDLSLSIPYK
jgi:hypothetical protein